MLIELWLSAFALGQAPPTDVDPVDEVASEAIAAFLDVVTVLQSPRCVNCHPAGDVPLQGDDGVPHTMGITRLSPGVGLPCSTCHRIEGLPLPGFPPADLHWGLPPANQVFEGQTPAQLCGQLKDPATTGGRDLDALLVHVTEDGLVKWGWDPGPERTVPPLTHDTFVERFATWVAAGGPCPDVP